MNGIPSIKKIKENVYALLIVFFFSIGVITDHLIHTCDQETIPAIFFEMEVTKTIQFQLLSKIL